MLSALTQLCIPKDRVASMTVLPVLAKVSETEYQIGILFSDHRKGLEDYCSPADLQYPIKGLL